MSCWSGYLTLSFLLLIWIFKIEFLESSPDAKEYASSKSSTKAKLHMCIEKKRSTRSIID